MEKRYQVFISSTYADLKAERQKVIQAVIEMDCIPAGMELFPAADEDQFQFIKRVIDDCDYYLLIIGGRYGSLTAEGISYTEKEYDYAASINLKVIALIHENPDQIPLGKSEKDPSLREKPAAFRGKVSAARLVKSWKSAEELPGLVAMSLAHAMKMFPAVGWVRANKAANVELLTELNELRKENAKLQAAATEFNPKLQNLAGLDDSADLFGDFHDTSATYYKRWPWKGAFTWADIFACISPYLDQFPNDDYVKSILARDGFKKSRETGDDPHLDDQLFRTVAVQFQALGLVRVEYSQTTKGSMALFWSLTPAGRRLMVELRTVKRPKRTELGLEGAGGR
jgi:hypothetical protein